MDELLLERLSAFGEPTQDAAGNIVLRIEGREPGPLRSVLAHKDEIGAIVKRVGDDGRLAVQQARRLLPLDLGRGAGRGARTPRHRRRGALVRLAARLG